MQYDVIRRKKERKNTGIKKIRFTMICCQSDFIHTPAVYRLLTSMTLTFKDPKYIQANIYLDSRLEIQKNISFNYKKDRDKCSKKSNYFFWYHILLHRTEDS